MPSSEEQREMESAGRPWFTTTHWSVVLAAGQRASPDSRRALAMLCERYWFPLPAGSDRVNAIRRLCDDVGPSGHFRRLDRRGCVVGADAGARRSGQNRGDLSRPAVGYPATDVGWAFLPDAKKTGRNAHPTGGQNLIRDRKW